MSEAGVRINDTKVSRQHARIRTLVDAETKKTEYVLTDLDSRNGTFINGQKITLEVLQNGDKIMIGEHILRASTFSTRSTVNTSGKYIA